MSPPSTSEGLAGLLGHCLRSLTQLEGTERAAVLTQELGEAPVVRAVHGSLDPNDLVNRDLPPGFALHVAQTDGKSVHSLDITQDPAFAGCARRTDGKSLVVVPMSGPAGRCGLLYADHTFKAGAFAHADVRRLESFAAEVGPRLQVALGLHRAAPPVAMSHEHVTALRLGGFLLLLALAWWGAGVTFHLGQKPTTPPPPRSVNEAAPIVVAASYLSRVRFKELASAYELLSARQQKHIPRALFEKEAAAWLRNSRNVWELDYRRAGTPTVVGRRADVIIQPAPGTRPWSYKLVQESDGGPWKLDRWDGGPLEAQGRL